MTTLGKILVLANLVISLVTGALILMVFITQTNWRVGHDLVLKQLVGERKEHNATIAARNALEESKNKDIADRDDKLKLTGIQLDAEINKSKKAETDLELATTAKNEANQARDAAVSASERMKAEIETLDKRLSDSTAKIIALETKSADAEARATKNAIEAKAALDRNMQLLSLLEQRENELKRSRGEQAAQAGSRAGRNPPPEDLRGRVTQTDGELITINLGSDSGLNKGNTMEIFRLAPKPVYLGTLQILNVRPNEAVGKLVGGGMRGRPQSGDEVASEIVSKH